MVSINPIDSIRFRTIKQVFELGASNQFLNARPITKSTKPRIQDHLVDSFIKGTMRMYCRMRKRHRIVEIRILGTSSVKMNRE